MLNLIIADLKIMFRYEETWLCIIGQLIFLAVTITGLWSLGDVSLIAEGYTLSYLMSLSTVVVYCMIMILFTLVYDFEMGMIKNTLTNGVTRKTYFFARLIVAYIFTSIFYLIHLISGIFLATVIHGFNALNLATFAVPLLLQLLILLTITTVGVGFIFAFRRSSKFGIAYSFTFMVPTYIFLLSTQIDHIFDRLKDFDLTTQLTRVANFGLLSNGEVTRLLILVSVYFVISIIVGMVIFEKAEIK